MAGRRVTAADIADRLCREKHVLVVSHESPDGDALGCLTAFSLMCERLGVPYVAYIPGDAPFPTEYRFLPRLDEVVRGHVPVVGPETTVYMLDCASLARGGFQLFGEGLTLVTIDHHQDNPGNADLNLIVPEAASTSVVLYDIFRAGRFPVDVQVAASLYVGLVTDTGRFQFSNTDARAHRIAAELQETGVDPAAIAREVYENVPAAKLRLLGRALDHMALECGGLMVTAWLGEDDFATAGADPSHAEGIIDTLRTVQGATIALLVRERRKETGPETKVSLRSTDGRIDVAAVAALKGGGGHKQAAGFTAAGDMREILDWTVQQLRKAL